MLSLAYTNRLLYKVASFLLFYDEEDTEEHEAQEEPQVQVTRTVSSMQRVGFDLNLYYQDLNLFGAVLWAVDDIEGTDHDPNS